jgi:uncharacterized membrane protein
MVTVISPQRPATARIDAIDVVRGAVMVLMAIDHVRVYAGVPAGGPAPAVFFTRWVTHFCAPAFVFFAGTSAFLHGQRTGDLKRLQRDLVVRGLMLVVLELTLIRFTWTFNLALDKFVLAGVIWMLGWCMVLMALLVRLRPAIVAAIGVAMIFGQQLFAIVPRFWPEAVKQSVGWIWQFVYPAGLPEWPPHVAILYVLVPWIGVMAAGYGFGAMVVQEPERRWRWSIRIGLAATAFFLVVGGLSVALNPAPPNAPPALFRLLAQNKYPASQLFLGMTLGPTLALLPLADRARGAIGSILSTFGRVPMFYYLLHIPAIHLAALAVNYLRLGAVHHEWYATAPFASVPPEARWSLPLLYLVFAIVVAVLYLPCRWYARVRASRKHPVLSFL